MTARPPHPDDRDPLSLTFRDVVLAVGLSLFIVGTVVFAGWIVRTYL